MFNQKNSEYNKVIIVLVVFSVLLLSWFIVYQQKKSEDGRKITDKKNDIFQRTETSSAPQVLLGEYRIRTNKSEILEGEEFVADVIFSLYAKQLDGSDVILKYNPEYLKVVGGVSQGEFFAYYPRMEVDNQNGVIKVSAFNSVSNEPVSGEVSFFKVKFQAKKEGEAVINFDFEKGNSSLTTLVEQGTSRNILDNVQGAKIIISR